MTLKPNTDNGLQGRTTEHQLPTAVLQKWRCSASYDSFVVGSSAVLRLNLCAKNPPLRKAAKRSTNTLHLTPVQFRNAIEKLNSLLQHFVGFVYNRIETLIIPHIARNLRF